MSSSFIDGPAIDQGDSFAYSGGCPDCQTTLDLHQPDPSQPDRLLGICPRCGIWVLIEIGGGGQIFLMKLPESPPGPSWN